MSKPKDQQSIRPKGANSYSDTASLLASHRSLTGACLTTSYVGCTCGITTKGACIGIFYEGVTLCSSIFSNMGGCCLRDPENNNTLPCQETTYCDCYDLATSMYFNFTWNVFTISETTCLDFNCIDDRLGACCDGNGECEDIDASQCNATNRFFQGIGTKCNTNMCAGGTGACCTPGLTCTNGISGDLCIESGRVYFGEATRCSSFLCTSEMIPCFSAIPYNTLHIGDVFNNGVVVGIYKPNQSACYGNNIFGSNDKFSSLVSGISQECVPYESKYDYNGYGFIRPVDMCDNTDSYLMLVALTSLEYNNRSQFTWSHGGLFFGPLMSQTGQLFESNQQSISTLKEGYIINSGLTLSANISIIQGNSHSICADVRSPDDTPITRASSHRIQSFNGRWSSDWGLYNTIRMTNAELVYESGMTFNNYITSQLYAPSITFDSMTTTTCTTALRNKNTTDVPSSNQVSSWYIPSINELSFLAHQCKFNNLNSSILSNSGSPLAGEIWSSTGSFNYTGSTGAKEGVSNGITADIGTAAWTINFNDSSYVIKKDNRLTTKSVRPIRLIRCDGQYISETDNSIVLWKVNT